MKKEQHWTTDIEQWTMNMDILKQFTFVNHEQQIVERIEFMGNSIRYFLCISYLCISVFPILFSPFYCFSLCFVDGFNNYFCSSIQFTLFHIWLSTSFN